MLRKNLGTFLLYEKFYILLDIKIINIIYTCIVNKIRIIRYFYTSCNIKEKCMEFFFFIIFSFLLFSHKLNYKKTWFLDVTSNKGFIELSTSKKIEQNEYCELHEL